MAWQSCHLSPESQYGQCVQPSNLALSTANLYTATQPGGSLFGLQLSNPVNTTAAYKGPSKNYGQPNDPLVGEKIGGVNIFGGGLALYDNSRKIIGAIGVSGDPYSRPDNIVYDITPQVGQMPGVSLKGWGPTCSDDATAIATGAPLPPSTNSSAGLVFLPSTQ